MAKLLQISPIEQKEPPKVNKNFLSLVPTKKGTPFWALYDGNSIVRWYISRTAGSKLNLYSNPSEIWYWKTFYSISKGEVTKAFNWKKIPTQVLSHSVIFSLSHWTATMLNTSMEKSRTRTSQFPAVLHTASLAKFKLLQVRWTAGEYAKQMVTMYIPNLEHQ